MEEMGGGREEEEGEPSLNKQIDTAATDLGGRVGGARGGGAAVCCLLHMHAITHTHTHSMVKSTERAGGWGWRRRRPCVQSDGAEEGHLCRHLPKAFWHPDFKSSCKETVGHAVWLARVSGPVGLHRVPPPWFAAKLSRQVLLPSDHQGFHVLLALLFLHPLVLSLKHFLICPPLNDNLIVILLMH